MPLYDYKCPEHGIFHELATINEHDKPQTCPTCGSLSARIILIAPDILVMPATKRKAHATNEKSSHAPLHSTNEQRRHDQRHSKTCGCSNNVSGSKLIYTARGEKMFPSMRPWMISH